MGDLKSLKVWRVVDGRTSLHGKSVWPRRATTGTILRASRATASAKNRGA